MSGSETFDILFNENGSGSRMWCNIEGTSGMPVDINHLNDSFEFDEHDDIDEHIENLMDMDDSGLHYCPDERPSRCNGS